MNPPSAWVEALPESKELLAICLKKVRGLNKVKLVDAGFVWTEPHSRRVKVKLTVQKAVFNSAVLQQEFVIEYIVANQQCDTCKASYTEHTWSAVAQVRQKVGHKKTFFWLEQLILKHKAHLSCISIKEYSDGLDFYFAHRSHAAKFVDFLQAVVPVRYQTAKKLISHDVHTSSYKYKHTFSVELCPICRDDLIALPTKVAKAMGHVSPLALCYKVSNQLHLIDPVTLSTVDWPALHYWKAPFPALATHKQLTTFIVLDTDEPEARAGKFALVQVTVARESDFGVNDTTYTAMTHLGNILQPGDTAAGYALATANFNDLATESLNLSRLPDVVLVRKTYPERRSKKSKRIWKLEALTKDVADLRRTEQEREAAEYEGFLQDLEEDPEMRAQIEMHKDPATLAQLQAESAQRRAAYEAAYAAAIAQGLAPEAARAAVLAQYGPEAAVDPLESALNPTSDPEGFPEVRLDELLDRMSLGPTPAQHLAAAEAAAAANAEAAVANGMDPAQAALLAQQQVAAAQAEALAAAGAAGFPPLE